MRRHPIQAGTPKYQEVREQPGNALTRDTAKIAAQGGLTLKITINCCTFLDVMSLSHMVFSDNVITLTQGCSEFPADPK